MFLQQPAGTVGISAIETENARSIEDAIAGFAQGHNFDFAAIQHAGVFV